jgi:hypothetical protein
VIKDFTFEIYDKLLDAGLDAGYEHITVREYLSRDTLPDRFIIYRHDVDRKPQNALKMAKLESEHNIPSTYYFRTIDKTLEASLVMDIEQLGHEVGYHYEDLDRADGDTDSAHDSFSNHIENLRSHATIDTVCMHGNPLTSHDNRDMWTNGKHFEEYDLLGEAYLSMDFVDVTYFSDTGRTWKDGSLKIKDTPVGETRKTIDIDSSLELIDLLKAKDLDRLCILSHPNRWADSTSEYYVERFKDTSINVAKRGISLLN